MKIRNTYILLVTIIGLFTLALYSTFAMFTASFDVGEFVSISASNLPTDTSMLEYERLTIEAGETKIIDLNINNKTTNSLYYGTWYEMIDPTTKIDTIVIAKLDTGENPTFGQLTTNSSKKVTILLQNKTTNSFTINMGVAYSLTSSLNLPTNRYLITDEASDAIDGSEVAPATYDFNYTGAVQQQTLTKGKYKLEVWGAEGGYRTNATYSGKGGYSYGTLTLDTTKDVFVYVGGAGNTGKTAGGFNGGGARTSYNGGGGASDIRFTGGTWSDSPSLLSRIIVAGGGGSDGAINKTGMYGGGTTGGSTTDNYGTGGYGGTQTGVSNTSWQTTTVSTSKTTQVGAYAGFGFGGNGINRSGGQGGAGGGGWYGGSGSYPDTSGDDDRGGAGGSGFVWTSSTASSVPSGYSVPSNYYLTDSATLAGNTSFISPSGANETGHSGNGYARITKISTVPSLKGLSARTIGLGSKIDLLSDVSCVDNGDGCTIVKVSITDTSILAEGEYTAYYIVKDNKGEKYRYSRKIKVAFNLDKSGANVPKLDTNMIPVIYNGSNWIKADGNNSNQTYQWYDYNNHQWANVVLVSSTNRSTYVNSDMGTVILEEDILAYYVWIPRYKYKVWNINKVVGMDSYGAQNTGIDIKFESGIASTGTISCNYDFTMTDSFLSEKCSGSNGEYYTHPAFTFGDKEVEGIWVGKFDTSSSSPNEEDGGGDSTTLTVRIKPNVDTWRNNSISNFYMVIKNMQKSGNEYGFSTDTSVVDTHMFKNMEWGAVAYLTNSNYGRCVNGTCSDIGINNNNRSTEKLSGCGAPAGSESAYNCNAYTTAKGQLASTTGNIYGIYDMSGGAYEYVMGNASYDSEIYVYNPWRAGNNFSYSPMTAKYIDTYAMGKNTRIYNRARLGDATGEVVSLATGNSGGGWYNDFAAFAISGEGPMDNFPWITRGGNYDYANMSGIFAFSNEFSTNSLGGYSARASLIVF